MNYDHDDDGEHINFRCLADPRFLQVTGELPTEDFQGIPYCTTPFGALFNVTPPSPIYDDFGNITNAPVPRVLKPEEKQASTKEDYQPQDRVDLSYCGPDGLTIKLKFFANNFELTPANIESENSGEDDPTDSHLIKLFCDHGGDGNIDEIPTIVKSTPFLINLANIVKHLSSSDSIDRTSKPRI
ncbi:hypothetical protein sscle_02g019230 [Sclerotinia sclerotiorum 1980 UF-70]|uniref:Uncharacterized protein n=1 Tax=Sclerotinia sclerotiorum (strain ATCC 18683 / 1980 / Ss-1) TaxID=665079 RepID=A0A1D9PXX2_SCLS1|nr:hypothetical protein sscle_02g019230 [Sclerotinia sclerotiorum 1980 UF-70]